MTFGSRRAFSLLEVMVAVAILGLALSVILGGQGGLAASNRTAANMGVASSLARCKMSELEEKLMREGYQELEVNEAEVSCCDTLDQDGFKCDIKIEKVVLPDVQPVGADAGTGLVGAAASAAGSPGSPSAPGADPLSSMLGGALDGGASSLAGLGQQVMGGGGADGLVSMAMGIVYPSLKPMLEASIRRVTVAVKWKEGPKVRDVTIVQFVTNPQRGGLISGFGVDAGAFGSSGGTAGTPGATGASGGMPTPRLGGGGGAGGGFPH